MFVPAARINAIIKGTRAITADTALRFGKYFGTGPEFWLNLQANYDLCLAEKEAEKDLTRIQVYAFAYYKKKFLVLISSILLHAGDGGVQGCRQFLC